MESEGEHDTVLESTVVEDTVVKPPTPVVDLAETDIDADTLIRDRIPFADVPTEALVELREPKPVPFEQLPVHGSPVPQTPVTQIQADLLSTLPQDYSFSVNSAEPISLDSPAFIGRKPVLPRIMKGRPPRLISVPSPLREVSSTHLELRQQGALVIVTDLRSTNGSVVCLPGRSPVTLRQGESLVVTPGTVVDIGDGNLVEISPSRRVESSEKA